MLDGATGEALLVAPLSTVVVVILGLVTFGADDFLDFLNAFFIELAIMMFERAYLGDLLDQADKYTSKIPDAFRAAQKWFAAEDDAPEGEGAEQAKEADDKDSATDDDGEVYYSESASDLPEADGEVVDEDPDLILNAAGGVSIDSKEGSGSGELSGPLARMEDAEADK